MEHCVFHPTHAAIEHCEICNRALCGLCLWYGDDGRRYCASHARELEAQGTAVLPPETYAEAIYGSLAAKPARHDHEGPTANSYRLNQSDLLALITAVAAVVTLFSCFGGAYCLPFLVILLGIAAYVSAPTAVDPRRARLLAGVGIGASSLLFLFLFAFIALYFFMIFIVILTAAP